MKIIYEIKNENEFLNQLHKIALEYSTQVLEFDDGSGHFIFVKSKIKISEKTKDNRKFAYVWGATEKDISYLNSVWGQPFQKIELKMTPIEFASELMEIPKVESLTKEEIVQIMEISDKDFNQYKRFIKMALRKSDINEDVKKASAILEQF